MSTFALSKEEKEVELIETIMKKPSCSIEGFVLGMDKNQDLEFHGTSFSEEFGDYSWGVLMDGHGTSEFINKMKELDWGNIMSQDDPWDELHKILINIKCSYGRQSTGSTLLMMRSFSNRVETISIGDSQIVIYKNGEIVYKSNPHNLKNPLEVERLRNMPPGSWNKQIMKNPVSLIRSSNTIRAKVSEYISFDCYTQFDTLLAMSQSIGHDNCTGYEPEKNVVYFEPEDTVRCILGSDGLFDMILLEHAILQEPPLTPEEVQDILQDQQDMLNLSSEELVRKAEMRWKQKWNFRWSIADYSKVIETSFGGYDDISVIVWKHN